MELARCREIVEQARTKLATMEGRPRNIPGTKKALNREVMRVLNNRALTPEERGSTAAGLITARMLEAYGIQGGTV